MSDLFNPSPEHRALRELVRSFTEREVDPQAEASDHEERFNVQLFRKLGELGLLGITVEERFGGAGLDPVAALIAHEELSAADPGFALAYLAHSMLFANNLQINGSDEQRAKYLPDACTGAKVCGMCMSEPGAGTDVLGMQTTAIRKGDVYVLNGAKMWITNGSIADVAVVWAQTDEGILGFLVEKDMPGFDAPEIEHKFSLRASVTSSLFFDNVRVPAASVLPGVVGLKGPLSCLTQARYGITWGAIGAAQACLREAIDYSNERELFGRPVSHTQTIQRRLADMSRRITTAQLLSLQLGRLKDAGAMQPGQVSMAKWNNVRMALDIARDARDVLGGAGISAEYCPIRHMLNLESVITYEGTETIHELVVGKELTGVNAF